MKLVRDRVPQLYPENGYVTADPRELPHWLLRKLIEETSEVMLATDPEEIAEELADVLEAVYALAATVHMTPEDLEGLRRLKHTARGGFNKGYLLVGLGS